MKLLQTLPHFLISNLVYGDKVVLKSSSEQFEKCESAHDWSGLKVWSIMLQTLMQIYNIATVISTWQPFKRIHWRDQYNNKHIELKFKKYLVNYSSLINMTSFKIATPVTSTTTLSLSFNKSSHCYHLPWIFHCVRAKPKWLKLAVSPVLSKKFRKLATVLWQHHSGRHVRFMQMRLSPEQCDVTMWQ